MHSEDEETDPIPAGADDAEPLDLNATSAAPPAEPAEHLH
jgi:hypothetical protein